MKINIWYIPSKEYLSVDELEGHYVSTKEGLISFKFNFLTGKIQTLEHGPYDNQDTWVDSDDFIVFYDNKEE